LQLNGPLEKSGHLQEYDLNTMSQSAQALLMSMKAKAGVERHEQALLEKEVMDKQDKLRHAARLTQGACNDRSSSEHHLHK
jgi:hypothetical protein